MDFSEKWGTDVDEAVKLALEELTASIDEVEVTVLEESSKGFFGLGSKLAKVRVEKKKVQKPERDKESVKIIGGSEKTERPERSERTERPERTERSVKKSREKREPAKRERNENFGKPVKREPERKYEKIDTERPKDLTDTTDHEAMTFIKELIDKMNIEVEIKAMKNDECIYIDIEGTDAGTLIGKRGQTLDAVQYLTSLVVNKNKEKYIRVVIDVENYRVKREKTLEQLADRLADKVMKTRRSVRLEPMNPYERKVIHARLQENPKIITRSEGEEPYRRVIIELK